MRPQEYYGDIMEYILTGLLVFHMWSHLWAFVMLRCAVYHRHVEKHFAYSLQVGSITFLYSNCFVIIR